MEFNVFENTEGDIFNPYAGKHDGGWVGGSTSIEWLNEHFGHCKSLNECIASTESEGLKLFFEYLKTQQ